jgi:hypothetical protein
VRCRRGPIDAKRLEAVPWTPYCLKHQMESKPERVSVRRRCSGGGPHTVLLAGCALKIKRRVSLAVATRVSATRHLIRFCRPQTGSIIATRHEQHWPSFCPGARHAFHAQPADTHKGAPVSSRMACATALSLLSFTTDAFASDAVDFAASLIDRPYVWGAEGPDAFDCSGLTQYVYQRFGIELPRRAISQSREGDPIRRRLQRGDLVFFSTDSRKSLVTHVGIYEGAGIMIDASKRHGRVRRDDLNDEYWAERFMFARRLGDLIEAGVRADDGTAAPDARRSGGRRTAIRVLERIAEGLLRRPRN